jgi:hypothetical protein
MILTPLQHQFPFDEFIALEVEQTGLFQRGALLAAPLLMRRWNFQCDRHRDYWHLARS